MVQNHAWHYLNPGKRVSDSSSSGVHLSSSKKTNKQVLCFVKKPMQKFMTNAAVFLAVSMGMSTLTNSCRPRLIKTILTLPLCLCEIVKFSAFINVCFAEYKLLARQVKVRQTFLNTEPLFTFIVLSGIDKARRGSFLNHFDKPNIDRVYELCPHGTKFNIILVMDNVTVSSILHDRGVFLVFFSIVNKYGQIYGYLALLIYEKNTFYSFYRLSRLRRGVQFSRIKIYNMFFMKIY